MAPDKAISCPIKLPPLDRYRLRPRPSGSEQGNEPPAIKINTRNEPASFSTILSKLKTPQSVKTLQTLPDKEEAGRQIESFFLALVFKQAFNNQISSKLFGDSYASRMFFDMFIDAVADEAAKSTPLGIAELITADINRTMSAKEEGLYETEELLDMRQGNANRIEEYLSGMR